MEFINIDRFYEENHNALLLDDSLRPCKSVTRDVEKTIANFVSDCQKNPFNTLTEETVLTILGLAQRNDTVNTNVRVMLEFSFIKSLNDSGYPYKYTKRFIDLVSQKFDIGNYILSLLYKIEGIKDLTMYLNSLLCTLREGYKNGKILLFPDKFDEFKNQVSNGDTRKKYRCMVFDLYGFAGRNNTTDDDVYTPNANYRVITELTKLGLIIKSENFGSLKTYELTSSAIHLLCAIDKNLQKKSTCNANVKNLLLSGAPGTGKSFELERRRQEEGFNDDHMRRVTFYPNYTFAQFVGCYKPVSDVNKNIEYKYIAGPFIQTYVEAKNNSDENFLLIIEELNRANAAAVFGDLFQLLDRKADGTSDYPVATSEDLKNYLIGQGISEEEAEKLSLPSNMYIWATMNSADQGVFPLDTAFKRRWEYEYIGIDDKKVKIIGKTFEVNGKVYEWNTFREAINKRLLGKKVNEDKLLGPFYVNPDVFNDNAKALDVIKSKVLMYVFEDAGRQYRNSGLFDKCDEFVEGSITYRNICDAFDKYGGEIFKVDSIGYKGINGVISEETRKTYLSDLRSLLKVLEEKGEDATNITSDEDQSRIKAFIEGLNDPSKGNKLTAYNTLIVSPKIFPEITKDVEDQA